MTALGDSAREIAVIDVGSNSVRLVQFRLENGALWPVYNEKTMAGLGRGAGETGKLNPDGVNAALRTLKRFTVLLDAKQIHERRAVATAAVRWCSDGADFVARVREETGLEIEVLSGSEEGRRSALGVICGVGPVNGVTGDLGGSSLELTPLRGRQVGAAVSLPLGPLSLNFQDFDAAGRAVDEALRSAEPLKAPAGDAFIAVGGAWRAFAQFAMSLEDHPIRLLHQYELTASQARRAANLAMHQSEASLAAVPGMSARRAPTLPYAAMLLEKILQVGRFNRLVISANGLREGVVCDVEPDLVERIDPLLAGAEALARGAAVESGLGKALADWIEPAFEGEPVLFGEARDRVLRAAAARLGDTGARMHPDHRADLATMQTLYAPFGGVTHPERAMLALAVHHRYAGRMVRSAACPARRLADDEGELAALRLGMALRLGAALSGRSAAVLSGFALCREPGRLILKTKTGDRDLVVERALRRFEQLAEVFSLEPVVE